MTSKLTDIEPKLSIWIHGDFTAVKNNKYPATNKLLLDLPCKQNV